MFGEAIKAYMQNTHVALRLTRGCPSWEIIEGYQQEKNHHRRPMMKFALKYGPILGPSGNGPFPTPTPELIHRKAISTAVAAGLFAFQR